MRESKEKAGIDQVFMFLKNSPRGIALHPAYQNKSAYQRPFLCAKMRSEPGAWKPTHRSANQIPLARARGPQMG